MSTQVAKNQPEGDYTADGKERYLVTASGKIRCLRCLASSTRTKLQCAKPALKISTTQKCGHHGGRPHSTEVLRRIAEANKLHGECSKKVKEQYRQDAIHIRHLEDAMHVLKMGEGPRIRGRKPNGYSGVYSEDDLVRVISERLLNRM
jgi:hypothetical protein